MPTVDHANKELLLKLVYYGPGYSGKTTNLKYIHARTRPEHRGTLLTLSAEAERTIFFEMLPVELGSYKGYSIRLHLCTVPGKVVHDRTRRHILSDVDGIVFVADSRRTAVDANVESLNNLFKNLRLHGLSPQKTPLVFQYNKRDDQDRLPLAELRKAIGVPEGAHETQAVASEGAGVFDTLREIVALSLRSVDEPKTLPSGRTPSILPGHRVSSIPRAEAGKGGPDALSVPAPPGVPEFGKG
jgi:signal recognition particle receptor subunit beta